MKFQIDHALEILDRTPATLRALLAELPAGWTSGYGGTEDWNPKDVVGHLVHGEETDWIPRAEILLRHGESRPFDPYDRLAQFERFQDRTLDELLERFAQLRRANLARLQAMKLKPEQYDLRGTHPRLGTVTLGELLATWVVHDLSHIGQITRAMAKRYRDEVGPWRAFLPALER